MNIFNILVDYDNIRIEERRKGIFYVIELIVREFNQSEIEELNIKVRLYSGWYDEENLTKSAQDLSSEIKSIFPTTIALMDGKMKIINVEMAYSLISHSGIHLFNTYRIRGFLYGLKSVNPVELGCMENHCPIKTIYDFIKNGKCSICGKIKPKDVFYKGEQKLVDTMITADMLFLAYNTNGSLCLVSSDDDFTPGIMTALAMNKKIVQVKTKNSNLNSLDISKHSSNYTLKKIY
jgi:uncharacterized LabA/DUF88 family protein